jgi:glycosyltransferase involved in cell wall biosynthesis
MENIEQRSIATGRAVIANDAPAPEAVRPPAREAVTVVGPAWNEEGAIGREIERLRATLEKADIPHEILVIDDGSTDGTAVEAHRCGARVVEHRQNLGYGRSLKAGILAARHDLIAITDADGTYPVERLPELLERARDYHMVVGQRTGRHYHGSLAKRLGRICFRTLGEFAAGRRIPDINSGFRVFRRSQILPFFPAISSGYSFTASSTLLYMLNDLFVDYIPVEYHSREGASKVKPLRDTLRALQIVVEVILRYNPIKIFLLLAAPFVAAWLAFLLGAIAPTGWRGVLLILAFLCLGTAAVVLSIGFATAAVVRRYMPPLTGTEAYGESPARFEASDVQQPR